MDDGLPWRIPNKIKNTYEQHGIKKLFDWQRDCLLNAQLFYPYFENLVYSAPTSSGKTLIAEIISACNILETGRRALFIFPYISSAREKLLYLQSLWRSANFVVKAFIGASSASVHGWSAAVCTLEKANTLLNAIIESDLVSEIGTIVVDEVHMIYDPERGAIVESILAKILYIKKHMGVSIQIIAMSATLDGHKDLGQLLNAHVFISTFRPLELKEFALMENEILEIDGRTKIRELSEELTIKNDNKGVIGITIEALLEYKAVIVFCSTKAETEQNAILIAKYIKYCTNKGDLSRFPQLNRLFPAQRQQRIVDYVREKTRTTERDLLNCISAGVAYHHAGLTTEEREEIEFLFKRGNVKVLISTSTLSSGVNLPAHRVVIRANSTSPVPINCTTYTQMVGRAGRVGQDNVLSGESYLLCSRSDWATIENQIKWRPFSRPLRRLTRILLETINSGLVSSSQNLEILRTCLFSKSPQSIDDELKCLNDLMLISMERIADDEVKLAPTQLGRAVLASSLDPFMATQIFAGLESAMKSICLDSELHMLFLITPINNLAINVNAINWNFFHQKWVELSEPLKRVAKRVGVTEEFFMQKMGGKMFSRDNELLNLHIRFFATLILFELINENPLDGVARNFKINRGLLQNLQQQAATYAYMIVSFCDRLGWYHLRCLLEGFAERLQFGVRRDLTELVQIQGIDAIRARAFYQNGITSLVALANCPSEKICAILRKAVPFAHDPNSEQNKNNWLFGEAPTEDKMAAQELINRARNSVKERIQSLSLKNESVNLSLRFDSSYLSVKNADDDELNESEATTTFVEGLSLSDDDDSDAECMENLCETLSPLRLTETLDAQNGAVITNGVDFSRRIGKKKLWSESDHVSGTGTETASPFRKKPATKYDVATPSRSNEGAAKTWNTPSFSSPFFMAPQCMSTPICHQQNEKDCNTVELLTNDAKQRWEQLNSDSKKIVLRMQRVGFYLNKKRAARMEELLLAKMGRLERKIYSLAKERFNLDSSAEVSKILFTKLKLSVPESQSGNTAMAIGNKRQPKRHFSTCRSVLKQIPHPICAHILKWRRVEHSLASLRSLLAYVCADDQRIRASFDNEGTISGRILTVEPNIQFVPKNPVLGIYSIRSVFCAPKGKTLLAADYKQLELRVLCELSSDKNLSGILNAPNGTDPFKEIASQFMQTQCDAPEMTLSRDHAKKLCYAIIYGMGANSLANEMKLKEKEKAQELINTFFRIFPSVKSWIEDKVESYHRTDTCETFLGRSATFDHGGLESERARTSRRCVNYIIQGTASEIFRQALVNIGMRLDALEAEIVMQLHDEVILEVPSNRLHDCAQMLSECMEGVFPEFSTHFPVKLSSGQNWGSLQPFSLLSSRR